VRLKKLVTSVAVLGMAGGMVVAASGIAAAESATLYPYIDWPPSAGQNLHATTLVGSTDPGNAGSELCLDFPMKNSNFALVSGRDLDLATPGHYSGRVNGVVSNPATQLDEEITLQDLATDTAACTGNAINFTATGSSGVVDTVHHKGSVILTTTAAVQSGILAGSYTNIRVHCAASQIVSTPSGALVIGNSNSSTTGSATTCGAGGGSVDYKLKLVVVKVKSAQHERLRRR